MAGHSSFCWQIVPPINGELPQWVAGLALALASNALWEAAQTPANTHSLFKLGTQLKLATQIRICKVFTYAHTKLQPRTRARNWSWHRRTLLVPVWKTLPAHCCCSCCCWCCCCCDPTTTCNFPIRAEAKVTPKNCSSTNNARYNIIKRKAAATYSSDKVKRGGRRRIRGILGSFADPSRSKTAALWTQSWFYFCCWLCTQRKSPRR